MNIEQQKRIAKEVLDKVKVLDYRAIIAGGAARDWYFNNLANDIDIFYYHEEGRYCLDNIRREVGSGYRVLIVSVLSCGFPLQVDSEKKGSIYSPSSRLT